MTESSDRCTGDTERCPACEGETFGVTIYPADTASVWCKSCENRVLLVDLRESSVDSRWFETPDTDGGSGQ